jgi:hypothetical protein
MRQLLAPVLAGVLLLSSAATVAAGDDDFYGVNPEICALFDGGTVEVNPDSHITVNFGWGSKSYGQEKAFLNTVEFALTVDGNPIDIAPYRHQTVQDPTFNIVFWDVPVRSLAEGESMTINLSEVFKQPIWDGFFHYPRGPFNGSPWTCVVTAVAPT